jgi:prepilin-type N-terminal cleavage/methylation domain-containing protein
MKMRKELNNKGFSLVELLIATIILGIVVAPLLHTFVTAANTTARSHYLGNATLLSENVAELVETTAMSDLDVLFEDYVTKLAVDGTKPDFTNPEIVEQVKLNLASRNNLDKLTAMKPEDVGLLARSMVDFVKGLSSQNGLVVDVKQDSPQLAGPEANNNERKAPEIKQPNMM